MRRVTGIFASLAVHGLFAAPLVWNGYHRAETSELPMPATVQLMDLANAKRGDLLDAQNGGRGCLKGRAYVGIGVQSDVDQRVTAAPRSYPAFKAGLRRGDILEDPDVEPDRDGYEIVAFTRRGKLHRLHIKTQWICLR